MNQERRLLRLREIQQLTGLSRSTIYRLQVAGIFPERIRLSQRTSAWRAAEIGAVIDARVAGKSDADIRLLVARLHEERSL